MKIQKIFKDILEEKPLPEELNSLIQESEIKIKDYLTLINSETEDKDKNSKLSEYKTNLNELFWRVIFRIIQEKTKLAANTTISFSEDEKQFMNFGFMDERLFADEKEFEEKLKESPVNKQNYSDHKILFLDEWFSIKYEQIMQIPRKKHLQEELANTIKKINDISDKIRNAKQTRTTILTLVPDGETIHTIMLTLDKLYSQEFVLSQKIIHDHNITADDRKYIANIKNNISSKENYLHQLMAVNKNPNQHNVLKQNDHHVKLLSIDIIKINDSIKEIIEEIEQDETERKTTLARKKAEAMTHEVLRLKNLYKICARRARTTLSSIIFNQMPCFSKKKTMETALFTEEFDPEIYKNSRTKKKGKPDILLLPGKGNGIYDWESNLFLIPLFPIRSHEESFANTSISYRLDVDEEKELLNSLLDVKTYQHIRYGMKLQLELTKDYITWMTKEAKGFLVLEKETRRWFANKIGPKFNNFKPEKKYTKLYSQFDEREKFKEHLIKCIEQDKKDLELNNLYLGLFYFDEEEYETATNYLNKSLEINPDNLDTIYNLALALEKDHKPKQAYTFWIQYIKHAENSWWTILAKNHAKKLREKTI